VRATVRATVRAPAIRALNMRGQVLQRHAANEGKDGTGIGNEGERGMDGGGVVGEGGVWTAEWAIAMGATAVWAAVVRAAVARVWAWAWARA